MTKRFALCLVLLTTITVARAEVLIVADEFPAMRVVAARLQSEEQIASKVVGQTEMPASLSSFRAVVVYLHHALSAKAENAFIDYARAGGRLVVLHHSISSGKRTNDNWFSFLGVSLPTGDVNQGGYKWIEGVTWSLVDLNPNHFIMTNRVEYPEHLEYASANAIPQAGGLPGFTLPESEVYLNHAHTGPHTRLMGLKFTDPKTGRTWMQDTAGWVKPAGKGRVVYLMPGHTRADFENPAYGRIVLNAVVWRE